MLQKQEKTVALWIFLVAGSYAAMPPQAPKILRRLRLRFNILA
jgi:hypothetical protein